MSETEVENGEYTICHRGRTGLLSTFVPAVHDLGEKKNWVAVAGDKLEKRTRGHPLHSRTAIIVQRYPSSKRSMESHLFPAIIS